MNNLTRFSISAIDTVADNNVQQYGITYTVPGTSNEYIYLPGVASLAAGDACVYTHTSAGVYTVSRLITTTPGRVIVALNANTGTTNGSWYLLNGAGTVSSASATSGGALFATATPGQVSSADTDDTGITGAHSTSATSSGTSGIFLSNAYYSGNVGEVG